MSFVFKHSKKLDELVEKYWRGKIKVDPQKFFGQLKTIKTRIYAER